MNLLKPLDRVRTASGRTGLVERVSGRHVDVLFPEGSETLDVDDLSLAAATPTDALLSGDIGDPRAYGLRLQSLFLRHAYRFDPRSGLSNARIEPNLYQIYIAHMVANKLQPRMILADEVGLGKTIEAGLVLKELRARGVVERVLIVTPASLQYQWQTELRSKFKRGIRGHRRRGGEVPQSERKAQPFPRPEQRDLFAFLRRERPHETASA